MQLTVPEPQADDYPVSGYILMSFRSGNQITLPRENFARLDINEGHANVIGYDGELQNSFDAQKLHYIEGCDYDLTPYQKSIGARMILLRCIYIRSMDTKKY